MLRDPQDQELHRKILKEKIPCLTFTVCVARAFGVNVGNASLVVVDPSCVLGERVNPTTNTKTTKKIMKTTNEKDSCLCKTIDCRKLVDKVRSVTEWSKIESLFC